MIFRHKLSGVVVQDAVVASTTIEGKNYGHNGYQRTLYITKDDSEQLFTESEVQQSIESAVAEHEQSHLEVLQGWHDECEKLKSRITELEAAQQPVEVSAELAAAIAVYKYEYAHGHWQLKFLEATDSVADRERSILATPYIQRLEIVKRGYTVKPDTLHTRIAAIIGSDHEQLEALVAAVREGVERDEKVRKELGS